MNFKKCLLIQCIIVWMCFPIISVGQSQHESLRIRPNSGLKVLGSFSFGTGGDKLVVGETTEGDDITLCSGGGFGMAITLGYNFFSKVDLDLSAGYQLNWVRPECDNMDGYFTRAPLLATAKYWIATKNNAFFKLGGGLGYYVSVGYELDASEAFNILEEIEYDNATGFHLVGEYEIISTEKPFSFLMGVKYYNVAYNAKSASVNGSPVPIANVRSEVRELKGSGFDFYFGFGWYF